MSRDCFNRPPRNRTETAVPEQKQSHPGSVHRMNPVADHGEESYLGTGKLKDRVAIRASGAPWQLRSPLLRQLCRCPFCGLRRLLHSSTRTQPCSLVRAGNLATLFIKAAAVVYRCSPAAL